MSESYYRSPTGRVKSLSRQQQACLDVLRAAGPRGATGMDLQAGGSGRQYPQRIKELRDDYGFQIPFAKFVGRAGNNSSIFKYTLQASPQVSETGVGANREPVHRSWVDDATPIPVCEAERLFPAPALSKGKSAVTGRDIQEEAA